MEGRGLLRGDDPHRGNGTWRGRLGRIGHSLGTRQKLIHHTRTLLVRVVWILIPMNGRIVICVPVEGTWRGMRKVRVVG